MERLSLTFKLRHYRKFRFKELAKYISISPRMLAKELRDLEMNRLVNRKVCDTKPITVEYSITVHGETLQDVIFAMRELGFRHRDEIVGISNKQNIS